MSDDNEDISITLLQPTPVTIVVSTISDRGPRGPQGPEAATISYALAADPDLLVVGSLVRDPDTGAVTSAPVVWPDGDTGTYTTTVQSTLFVGKIDAYTITKGASTFTQPAVTRSPTTGLVTVRPVIVMT